MDIDLASVSDNEETDWIMSDPLRLHQLMRFYIEIAITFNNRSGYILRIVIMTFLRDGSEEGLAKYRLSISCADTGPGIADVSGLFMPFSQVDWSTI